MGDDELGKPLTRFLIALGHSGDMLRLYQDDSKRTSLLREWGLEDHPALQPGATLEDIQIAVDEEHVGEDPGMIVTPSVMAAGVPRPTGWIRSASTDD
jgi:hypothetical protein